MMWKITYVTVEVMCTALLASAFVFLIAFIVTSISDARRERESARDSHLDGDIDLMWELGGDFGDIRSQRVVSDSRVSVRSS